MKETDRRWTNKQEVVIDASAVIESVIDAHQPHGSSGTDGSPAVAEAVEPFGTNEAKEEGNAHIPYEASGLCPAGRERAAGYIIAEGGNSSTSVGGAGLDNYPDGDSREFVPAYGRGRRFADSMSDDDVVAVEAGGEQRKFRRVKDRRRAAFTVGSSTGIEHRELRSVATATSAVDETNGEDRGAKEHSLDEAEEDGEDAVDEDATPEKVQVADKSLEKLQKIHSFIPKIYKMTKDEVVTMLLDNVLYNEDDVIAINKPYGLPSYYSSKMPFSVITLLPLLRPFLAPKSDFLRLIHRLDQQVTGVLLLAKSQSRAREISELMKQRKVVKTYICITKKIPDPKSGTIRIPLAESEISHRFKIVPMVMTNEEKNSSASRRPLLAETEYRVVGEGSNCAFVECTATTGVKHQIRCHLGYGIDCPVLGDHKYSNFLKYAPQRLSGVTLQRLGIRASKARHLPMFLHASKIEVPRILSGKDLVVKASLPQAFRFVMRNLRIHW